MTTEKLLQRLHYIEQSLTAKGHPLQDAGTIKLALLDLIEVMRQVIGQPKAKAKKPPRKAAAKRR